MCELVSIFWKELIKELILEELLYAKILLIIRLDPIGYFFFFLG